MLRKEIEKNQGRHSPSRTKRLERKRILIISEGERTEPRYFEQLKNRLELVTADVKIIPATDSAPIHVFNSAVEEQKEAQQDGNEYDIIYCVFDRDRHSTFQEASKAIEEHDGLEYARSAPCIEYWFLLHFTYANQNFTLAKECTRELRTYCTRYSKKVSPTIFEALWANRDTAKKHAKKALQAKSFNSFTEVHLLLEELELMAK